MKTDNEIIAEFMGFTCAETDRDRFWNPPGMPFATIYNWKYHTHNLEDFQTSWDWLMPAFDKFASMEFDDTDLNTKHADHCTLISEKILEVDIFHAHERFVSAIKWYNENVKP